MSTEMRCDRCKAVIRGHCVYLKVSLLRTWRSWFASTMAYDLCKCCAGEFKVWVEGEEATDDH